jgi:hypothetical protein
VAGPRPGRPTCGSGSSSRSWPARRPRPFQRVAAAGDFGNGVAAAFDRGRYSCINPDLTITLHRLPVGEWVGLDSATYPEPTGDGVAESVLHDEQGRIGRGIQTVLVEPV